MSRRILFWVLLVSTLILDQAVKAWARTTLAEGQAIPVPFPGIFEITLTYNRGIAFGLMQGAGVLLAPVAVAIALGAVWYNRRHPNDPVWGHIAASLLASGALGNLYDRLFLGKVTDMFWFRLINFPVFNIADACITIAALMLIFSWMRDAFRPQPQAASVHETPAPSAE